MKNSYLISQQVPEFVLTQYPAFVEFIEAYYQWLEQGYTTNKLESLLDIEDTLSRFLKYFKKELDVFNILAKSDDRFLLKNLKQLYKAKGSEAAFKFFFKIVSGKDIQITYPWHNVLKVSDGMWNQSAAVFIKISLGTPESIVGKTITIRKGDTYYNVVVERYEPVEYVENDITKTYQNIYQFFINKEYYNKIPFNARVSFVNVFVGYTINTTTEVSVYRAGGGFRVGEIYAITDGDGTGSIFKIQETISNGGIKSVQLIKFGVGYKENFSFSFLPHSIKSEVMLPNYISKNGTIIDGSAYDYYNNIIEKSHINTFNYNIPTGVTPAIPPSYAGRILTSTYYDNTFDYGAENQDKIATILVKSNTVSKYPGYFENNNGFVSDTMFLQDNFYYQVYSYEITIDETLSLYKNLLLKTIHPSGLKLFGNQTILNEIILTSDIKNALFKLENLFNELLDITDDKVFNLRKFNEELVCNSKYLSDPLYTEDQEYLENYDRIVYNLLKPRTDSTTANDMLLLNLFGVSYITTNYIGHDYFEPTLLYTVTV